jgi:hypothetical protein
VDTSREGGPTQTGPENYAGNLELAINCVATIFESLLVSKVDWRGAPEPAIDCDGYYALLRVAHRTLLASKLENPDRFEQWRPSLSRQKVLSSLRLAAFKLGIISPKSGPAPSTVCDVDRLLVLAAQVGTVHKQPVWLGLRFCS